MEWTPQNASVVSAGYAFTKMPSLCGRDRTKKWILRFTPAITAQASPKSLWAWPAGCDRGDEHLPGRAPALSHVVFDDGVADDESVLVPQPLVDALGGMTLLLGDAEVVFEYPVYDSPAYGSILGLLGGLCLR